MPPRMPIESGVPDPFQYMHPVMTRNYGAWKYHERPRPGVLCHTAKSGDKIWTVRAGTQRQMDLYTIRKLCDIADEYGDGFIRFTIRSNIEFMVADEAKVQPLVEKLQKEGFPVGGTGPSVTMIAHTQGWLHCDIPGTDASGVVKSLTVKSIVVGKVTLLLTFNTPSRLRLTMIWSLMCVNGRPLWHGVRSPLSARHWLMVNRRWKWMRRNVFAAGPVIRPVRPCKSMTQNILSSPFGSVVTILMLAAGRLSKSWLPRVSLIIRPVGRNPLPLSRKFCAFTRKMPEIGSVCLTG